MGWSAMRESTSRNQANGSIFTSSQEVTKLRSTAAVFPPLSLPKNVQLLRPTAMQRIARSVALLSMARSPSSAYRVNAAQFFYRRILLPVRACRGELGVGFGSCPRVQQE